MLDVAGDPFPPVTMVLKYTELLKQKRILSDIETNLSECLGGNKCQHLVSYCKRKFMIGLVKISAINKLKFRENKGRINDSKTYSFFLTSWDLL